MNHRCWGEFPRVYFWKWTSLFKHSAVASDDEVKKKNFSTNFGLDFSRGIKDDSGLLS
jgi:hypothetical protein